MKTRWNYGVTDYGKKYYKELQVLTWRFYFRFIRGHAGWFIPCSCCQKKLDALYKENVRAMPDLLISIMWYKDHPDSCVKLFCKGCSETFHKQIEDAEEVIFGNKDYEPLLEISRSWIDDESNTIVAINEEEYTDNRPYEYIEDDGYIPDKNVQDTIIEKKEKINHVNINEAPAPNGPEPEIPGRRRIQDLSRKHRKPDVEPETPQ